MSDSLKHVPDLPEHESSTNEENNNALPRENTNIAEQIKSEIDVSPSTNVSHRASIKDANEFSEEPSDSKSKTLKGI